ncbi:MAG: 50S ribosomal protein L6 [Proteobacteria bacterium]|jgi:large subunit ribosomal protein L6|nr:50S ribosomal protein L6 [Pseudomonadota bacterium]
MSRIGKKPIEVPKGVTVDVKGNTVSVKGPKGSLTKPLPPHVKVKVEGGVVVVERESEERQMGAYQGLTRALLSNLVTGVTRGFEKKMALEGVGYRVALQGTKLVLNLGYSSPVEFPLPKGIEAEVAEKGVAFALKGIDKELLGQTAATIRGFRPPEPYKGKGIRYVDEKVRRKAGKAGGK